MDNAEVCRRALVHRLQEAFAKPGQNKPHEIEIPSACEGLWERFVDVVRALAKPADADGLCFIGDVPLTETTTREIEFRLQPDRRLLVAHCRGGW